MQQPTDHQQGHRQRLKARFLEAGVSSLADYELLELLLFQAIPRQDVKPIAKQLLTAFGSFAGVINADLNELKKIKGVGESSYIIFQTIKAATQKFSQQQVLNKPILGSWKELLDYCRTLLAHEKVENFHLLFLDRKNRLIADETHQRGTIDRTPAYPREIVKRALELGASALILVHNHPSGDPTPSKADIDLTEAILQAAEALDIKIHDHLIISKTGHTSFKSLGML